MKKAALAIAPGPGEVTRAPLAAAKAPFAAARAAVTAAKAPAVAQPGADGRTRARVAALLLARGAITATSLGEGLGLSPAAVRRHLDAMVADGEVIAREQPGRGNRGRGRPAKVFALTDAGRLRCATHTYDDLASAALHWISRTGGDEAVAAFATEVVAGLEARCQAATSAAGDDPWARAQALADALSTEGYAASASAIATGGQLCQHHCPVAHVAVDFPQLCEAETALISRLVGTHVQRLATIAHGDGVCTTHIPDPRVARGLNDPTRRTASRSGPRATTKRESR